MVFHALTFARSRGRCWKPRPEAEVLNTTLGTWRMLMHWKSMFDRYYCIKTEFFFSTFRVISCTFLFRLITDVLRTQFLRTMLVLEPGSTHLMTAAILWPRYVHNGSCVAVNLQRVNCLVNTRLSAGKCMAYRNARHCFLCNNVDSTLTLTQRWIDIDSTPCACWALKTICLILFSWTK